MRISKLAVFAIGLWLISAALFAWKFINGSTSQGSDGRTAIELSTGERDLVLSEMRTMLMAVQGITQGLAQEDKQRIAAAARQAGSAAAADVNPVLMTKLPMDFKKLGMSMHGDMDALAAAAEQGEDKVALERRLGELLNKCTACHSAWQLKAAN